MGAIAQSSWVAVAATRRHYHSGDGSGAGGLVVLAIVLFGAWLAYYFSDAKRTEREMAAVRRYRLADAPEGAAIRIVGRVRMTKPPLMSPLSGRLCAYYRIHVATSGKHSRSLLTLQDKCGFSVEDDTGSAIVQIADAKWVIRREERVYVHPDRPPTEELAAFIAEYGKGDWKRGLEIYEQVLEVDEEVAILGACTREPVEDAAAAGEGYRDAPGTQLRFASSPSFPLRISDERSTTDPDSGTQPQG